MIFLLDFGSYTISDIRSFDVKPNKNAFGTNYNIDFHFILRIKFWFKEQQKWCLFVYDFAFVWEWYNNGMKIRSAFSSSNKLYMRDDEIWQNWWWPEMGQAIEDN